MGLIDKVVIPPTVRKRRFYVLFVLWKIPMLSADPVESMESLKVVESFDTLAAAKAYADRNAHQFLPGMAMIADTESHEVICADLFSVSMLPLKWIRTIK